MHTRCKAKAVEHTPLKTLFFIPLAPMLLLLVVNLPIADFERGLLEGGLVGTQLLLVLSLYRAKTRKK
ncbi:hypothetical protein [Acetobacter orleanensis]|uniref:Uncharacterized protein n=1 Tax=Acetobacter orleanensis TaxID=104099 RepID=A0A4Y3TLW3_9PROT|nr:hypothetical protein [Acetobacter orleanensis]KXV62476.1 hypothetical protein AD949_10065 [Acetobacter orleanensis]PCD80097.1 hypothetical protein CO710_04425 [Acetobacter orleanensis]GAN68432.1 hypothetical protein Abol_015_271 [Acetobacter orleanensis JCM 7639]GBR22728.1 hypothetical protein AA0473_0194 [Acetobacter orleanensis NRIC 0473]GEB82723.1 hypothetical protein AOR01nite_12000 [Acetobacter orleanensis]